MKYQFVLLFALIMNFLSAQSVDSIAIKQVDSLIKVFRSLFAKQDFEKALEIIGIAEKIAIEKLGKESATYGVCCFNHGRILKSKADYQQAEKWYIEAKVIQEKALGMNHPNYANTQNSLAVLYKEMGHYEKAELLYLESKDIRAKALGKEHPDYAQSMNNLANLYYIMSQYEKVEPLYLESKDIREKALGKQHPDYAQSLNNLGNLCSDMGQYEKAELFYLEANAIREKALGKEHPDYTESLSNLAVLYYEMGQYEKAEPLYLEANAIREKALGKEHPVYVQGLSNLARLYHSMSNYEKAEAQFIESKAIFEKALGKEHLDYAKCLNNLANLYEDMRQCEKAEPLFLESKAILEKALGREHPEYARILSGLANLYVDMKQYEKAEPIYLESIAIFKKALGKEHPDYAKSLNNLATLYSDMGQYEKAEPLFLESKDIRGNALGKEHPDYANSLGNLVQLYEMQSRFSESALLLSELNTLVQARLSKAISILSERELESYKSTFQSNGDGLGSYILARLKYNTNEKEGRWTGILPSLEYDHALFYKGFLLTAAAQLNAMADGSPKSKEISLRLKSYRRQLAAEFARPIADRKNVVELEEKANTAEKELARSIAGYAEAKRQVKWEDVMSTLRKDEAAIEFVSFKVSFPRWTDSVMYAALILKSGKKQPEFILLFEEKSLDSLLHSKSERKADYVNSLYTLVDRGAVAVEAPIKSLYEILWKPLENELNGIKTIYFSPSGLLHRINIDAIPISETETLADKYQLIELNSTRQLVIPTQLKNVNNDALLFGGIQFEQDSTVQNNEPLISSRSRGELSFHSVDSSLRGGTWNYLAGTEREVTSIEKIMQTAGVQTTLKKGYSASEEFFKNISANNNPSPRILHIATHGYFFPDPDRTISAESRMAHDSATSDPNKMSGARAASSMPKLEFETKEPVFKISDHPMLRSGLIMAGGNAAWQGKQTLEGREDGILTAYEISQMNLSNTELVVLSACETGLGDIQGNEGVYGLQRAFKIAGAKYLIMSLWQVPDKQTSLLMTTFYKKWLENKMSIPDAFHAAQKELREVGLDPYQWAGFVLVE